MKFKVYPRLVLGGTDSNGSIVLSRLAIDKADNPNNHLWVLKEMEKIAISLGLDFNPKYSIADSAPQLSKAIQEFRPGSTRINCWTHVHINIQRMNMTLPECFKNKFLDEVGLIQPSSRQRKV
ncbi:hypothetical protein AYI68_g3166 [Smittium mucronatum]|uniref:MULE transposase domain-containing protein n=1 Tax=Smittium mucronatum TaxID=133383 RepID=A0A1R0H0P1_9FUNG|nr:hypothetical protein AYI68_g3166 [Smittium mucronatum]